jgi:2-polyprenyl-6-hydroxyphenyl methylase/3-demethylubiquinone-9 3-methyltransferase
MRPDTRQFSFGQNWKDFLDHSLDAERIEAAKTKTRSLLRLDDLQDMSFVDVGCGSGLFSFIAHNLRASRVISFDVDPLSIECCEYMKAKAGAPDNWQILHGSVLNEAFVETLPAADVVYSWGVLHHTGDMWRGIRNAARLVKPGGRFAIAIYNRVEFDTLTKWRGSQKWLRIKRLYNRSSRPVKRAMELGLASKNLATMLIRAKNPVDEIREYRQNRGMSWWFDIVDWLGGYPYEFASAGEIFRFCHDDLGLQLETLITTSGIGCHEFLFRSSTSACVHGVAAE